MVEACAFVTSRLSDYDFELPPEQIAQAPLEARDASAKALTELPDEQRRVVEMAYFGGMTQAAIADELHIPLGTVKTRTLAAMQKLRRFLETEDR